ncbi:hypothetical protein GGR24_002285 [Hansschlegelia beijingensis]|uniref:Uncharacterized protein n=1 Tax=Hansschlegelia beijingensis TaxID=1133344 RepID=A0A7W6CYX5_9HYPH|nr:hypothetical protein [Hansschlegelia beijingensis]
MPIVRKQTSRLAPGMGEGPAFPTATRALANRLRAIRRFIAPGQGAAAPVAPCAA